MVTERREQVEQRVREIQALLVEQYKRGVADPDDWSAKTRPRWLPLGLDPQGWWPSPWGRTQNGQAASCPASSTAIAVKVASVKPPSV